MNFTLQFPSSFHIQTATFLLLLFIFYVNTPSSANRNGNETDSLALLAIKSKNLQDPRGVMRSWNHSSHFCNWQGVTCGHRHRRVTILDLPSRGVVGSLSPHIGNMSFLKVINLSNNTLEGEIPPEIGRLHRLQSLLLDNNSFRGEIPANISHCFNLVILKLGYNKLIGKIPDDVNSLLKLKIFYVHYNNLTGGIPPFLGNLTSLESLSVAANLLEGSIPDELGRLNRTMRRIAFGGNKLSGTIPPSIYNLSFLTVLSFSFNQLDGNLLPEIGTILPHLQILQLDRNNFTGPLPHSISNCSELQDLSFDFNQFSGKIRVNFGRLRMLKRVLLGSNNFGSGDHDEMDFLSSMANQTNLEVLELGKNRLTGVIPNSVGNLSTTLYVLSFFQNSLYGSLPSSIAGLVSLSWLNVFDNHLTGTIPSSISSLQKLQIVALSSNEFFGNIPHSLGNLTMTIKLSMRSNRLEGAIPSSLGKLESLQLLRLDQNNLSGSIPKELFELQTISEGIDLSYNQLSGKLPPEVGNLKHMSTLNVKNNKLSGAIPTSIGGCQSLQFLYLASNLFQGSIPSSLRSLRGMEELDLSSNNFSGQIPVFMEQLSLNYLNLSFNDFVGEVPSKGVFTNVSAVSILGNPGLCGVAAELHLPKCATQKSKKGPKISHALIIVIAVACLILSIGIVSSCLFCWLRNKRKMQKAESMAKKSFPQISYARLLKATDGFSLANLIGSGSFGTVYKGILDDEDNGMIVAVKVIDLQHRGAFKSFVAECEALRNIRHRNLVKIITSCSSVDFQGNDFKALVYEFMPNGSLEKWLHSSPRILGGQDELHRLGLLQRINIAIDMANAVDYLHRQCEAPIIHCDLKPSNILLDTDMVAHIGDFGLARFLLPELPDANPNSSIGIRGTIGYAAPEYGLGSQVSANGDIYSFGILLLEMMTGKSPVDPMFHEGLNLHNYAETALRDHVMEIIEPILLTSDAEEMPPTTTTNLGCAERVNNGNKIEECLISMLKIGVACSMDSPQDRMDISSIVHELHSVRSIYQHI